jgi:hypothetical protein
MTAPLSRFADGAAHIRPTTRVAFRPWASKKFDAPARIELKRPPLTPAENPPAAEAKEAAGTLGYFELKRFSFIDMEDLLKGMTALLAACVHR